MVDPNATKGKFQMSRIGFPIEPNTTPDYAVKPETLSGQEAEIAEQEYQRGMAERAAQTEAKAQHTAIFPDDRSAETAEETR